MPDSSVFADYNSVIAEVERVASQNADEPISAATFANVRDLVALCRNGVPVPDSLGRGYWPTIWLQWGFVQVEIFNDHLEVYHLQKGQSSIRHEEHQPGATFSQWFLDEVSALGS